MPIVGSPNVNEAEQIATDEGGNLVVWKDLGGGNFGWYHVPLSVIDETRQKADTALQPEQVDTAAAHPAEDFVMAEYFTDVIADRDAQIASLQAQIDTLSALIGTSSIAVFGDDTFEPGVFN